MAREESDCVPTDAVREPELALDNEHDTGAVPAEATAPTSLKGEKADFELGTVAVGCRAGGGALLAMRDSAMSNYKQKTSQSVARTGTRAANFVADVFPRELCFELVNPVVKREACFGKLPIHA
jgi:hypothetical protein